METEINFYFKTVCYNFNDFDASIREENKTRQKTDKLFDVYCVWKIITNEDSQIEDYFISLSHVTMQMYWNWTQSSAILTSDIFYICYTW